MDKNLCKKMKLIDNTLGKYIKYVPNVGEESITDWLVWKWKELNSSFNFVTNLKLEESKKKESKTGADLYMELWVVKNKVSLPIIIQAKKIFKNYNSEKMFYSKKILYKSGKKPTSPNPDTRSYQIDLLINSAKKDSKLPLYLFYGDNTTNKYTMCNNYDWVKNISKHIFFSDAELLRKNLFTKCKTTDIKREEILNNSLPFECLFCCPITFCTNCSMDTPNIFEQYFGSNTSDIIVNTNNLPNYVNEILNFNKDDKDITKNVIDDIKSELDSISSKYNIDSNQKELFYNLQNEILNNFISSKFNEKEILDKDNEKFNEKYSDVLDGKKYIAVLDLREDEIPEGLNDNNHMVW